MDAILPLLVPSHREPPFALDNPVEATPFFQVGPEGFLMLNPSGGRLHYAPGVGVSLANAPGRPDNDLLAFATSSGFAAAGWLEGRVPLRANAVQLQDGRLLLLVSDRDDASEAMAIALCEGFGFPVSELPVIIDPEDPTRACTNGQPMTMRRTSKESPEPPVRDGARRLKLDHPVIDGTRVQGCAGLICIGHGATPALTEMTLMRCVTELKKHVFMPLVGNAIWGPTTINAAYMVLASNLPMLEYCMPLEALPSVESARDLMAQYSALGAAG